MRLITEEEYEARMKRIAALEAENAELKAVVRCGTCGSHLIRRDACPSCSFPNCCQQCCKITSLEEDVARLTNERGVLQERINKIADCSNALIEQTMRQAEADHATEKAERDRLQEQVRVLRNRLEWVKSHAEMGLTRGEPASLEFLRDVSVWAGKTLRALDATEPKQGKVDCGS